MTIDPSTFTFLQSLAENNNREWFQQHKDEYESARENILLFTKDLIKGLSLFDPTISADLEPKTCVMRIYRDVRFSLNKLPYKNNFGIGISSKGKNFPGPGYYFHVQPEESFIAAGCWHPEPGELKAIRQEIDYNSSEWHGIIDDKDFIEYFGGPDVEDKLKTSPKGYPADHPDIEYLKLKSFVASRRLAYEELIKENSSTHLAEITKKIYPFMVFLRNAIS